MSASEWFAAYAEKIEKQRLALIEEHGVKYDSERSRFILNVAECATIDSWVESLKPKILALSPCPLGSEEPYYGATGGGITYSFTSTSLGTIVTVKEAITGEELNVTQALNWYFYD